MPPGLRAYSTLDAPAGSQPLMGRPLRLRRGLSDVAEFLTEFVSQFSRSNRSARGARCGRVASGGASWARPRAVEPSLPALHAQARSCSARMADHRSRLSGSLVSSIRVAMVHTCPDGSMIQAVRSPQN